MGTLNNLNTTSLVISNNTGSGRAIALHGGANTVSGSASDLIHLADNASLTIQNGTPNADVSFATSVSIGTINNTGSNRTLGKSTLVMMGATDSAMAPSQSAAIAAQRSIEIAESRISRPRPR